MDTQRFRPPGPAGRGDKYLRDVAREVQRALRTAQREFQFDTLRLDPAGLAALSMLLTEFAEDLHNDIGIWRTYEDWNRQWFGVRLPMTEGGDATQAAAISSDRVRHLLWVLFTEMDPDLTLAPTHPDLTYLTEVVAGVLAQRMVPIPRNSGIKLFMATTNEHGWDVKRKLVWLGTKSYLFRTACRRYLAEQRGDQDDNGIGETDDFLCQECTQWSGLGVPDLLAGVLPLTEEQRTVLRGWHERHASFYRVDVVEPEVIRVTNLANDEPYVVMMGAGPQPFRLDAVIFGSLVPWGGYWYWSGVQRQYPAMDASAVANVRKSLITTSPSIVYRYRKDLLAKAEAANERHYRHFLSYHQGKDLVTYPDGLSMAADEQRRFRLMYEAGPRESVDRVMTEKGLKNPWPQMTYPDRILNCKDGVGLHYDRQEGVEMMIGFNDITNGFAKKGSDLIEAETEGIKEFVRSRSVSPAFVRRMVHEHGDASLRAAFLLHDRGGEYAVEYLLRRYKGAAFHTVYPNMSLMQ
jgi:hypothetical protein